MPEKNQDASENSGHGNRARRRRSWLWLALPLALVLLLLLAAWPELENGTDADPVIGEILENPSEFDGQTVTVTAETEDVRGPRSFTVDGPGILNDNLLVVAPVPVTAGQGQDSGLIKEGDRIVVSGTVRNFNQSELEDEMGVQFAEELSRDFDNRPVLVAGAIDLVRQE